MRERGRTVGVDIRVEYSGNELDVRGLGGVGLVKGQEELEGPVLKGGLLRAKDDGVPDHDIVRAWGPRDTLGRVGLEPLKVSHQTTLGGRGH